MYWNILHEDFPIIHERARRFQVAGQHSMVAITIKAVACRQVFP